MISKLIAIISATIVPVVPVSAKDGETRDCRTIVGGQVICGNLGVGITPEQNKVSLKKQTKEIRAGEAEKRIQFQMLVEMTERAMSAEKDSPDARETPVALNDFARTCQPLARHNEAEPLHRRVVESFQSKLGPPARDIANETISHLPGLPAIGKWMIDQDGAIADWLGEIYEGKKLHEPVNIILLDTGAASATDARARLVAAATAAGYAVRFGHSSGYRGFIGGMFYDQLPTGFDDAFSNGIFDETNNHGRVFGPHRFGELYVFVAAFSRERVNFLEWPSHRYASFNRARDDIARHLDERSVFKAAGFVRLDNAIVDDPVITTGDHDGCAVVLRAGNDKRDRIGTR